MINWKLRLLTKYQIKLNWNCTVIIETNCIFQTTWRHDDYILKFTYLVSTFQYNFVLMYICTFEKFCVILVCCLIFTFPKISVFWRKETKLKHWNNSTGMTTERSRLLIVTGTKKKKDELKVTCQCIFK